MGLTGRERQARWLRKQEAEGLAVVTIIVPAAAGPDLRLIAEALRADRSLVPGPLRDAATGRLVGAKAALRNAGRR